MANLKIKLLAYQGAPESLYVKGAGQLEKLLEPDNFEIVEYHPDVLFFLSGGSEQFAVELAEKGRHYLLIGSRHGNSYASATEVKAWLNREGIPALLLDEEAGDTPASIEAFRKSKEALVNLQGKRIGLVGKVSGWLVASDIPASRLKKKFGMERSDIEWDELPEYSGFAPSDPFLDHFAGHDRQALEDTARVSEMLVQVIRERKLDAVTVECFPLVKANGVTACLPLAHFNDLGFPAGCEGDLTALVGMMLGKELTGTVPWIANINHVGESGCLFSHCTIAPGLVDDPTVMTHYETGEGTAIRGRFRSDTVTVFRFDSLLERAFIATGTVTGRPRLETACRTQIEVKLDPMAVKSLREDPLGNHHLILPGDCSGLLRMGCWMAGVEVMLR